jgi:hypothetical protein
MWLVQDNGESRRTEVPPLRTGGYSYGVGNGFSNPEDHAGARNAVTAPLPKNAEAELEPVALAEKVRHSESDAGYPRKS